MSLTPPFVVVDVPSEQSELLLQTPVLLNSLLNVSTSRNWLTPTLGAMRLHAYITQALYPGQTSLKFAQLPGIKQSESEEFTKESDGYEDLAISLEEKQDGRLSDIKKAISRWGKLDLVDASFKGMWSCPPCPTITHTSPSYWRSSRHAFVLCLSPR